MVISYPAYHFDDAIAQTLLIPLYGRAVESRQENPLIIDPYACQLADYFNKNGYDLTKFGDRRNTVGCAVRAKHFDHQVLRFIKNHQNTCVVVNIGAGLDARYQRIGASDIIFTKNTIFYTVDLPEVLQIREALLPACTGEIFMSGSILTTDWLDKLHTLHPNANFIFIVEGVLMYFNQADNRQFLQNLANRFGNSEIHFDMPSQFFANHSDQHIAVKHTKARFKFGIDNAKKLESWHQKLKHIHTYYYGDFKEARAMGLVWSKLMHHVPFLRHSFKMLHYHILS